MPQPPRQSDLVPSGFDSTRLTPTLPKEPAPAVAVTATFTAEAIEPTLSFWLRKLGFDLSIRFAPYNQVFQQLLDPAGLLARNRDGLNVILARFEDWARFRGAVDLGDLEENVRHLESSLRSASASWASPTLVCLCPASPDFLNNADHRAFLARSEDFLRRAVQNLSTVNLVTTPELDRLYPVPNYFDRHADELGHVPYTPEFFAALGTMTARKLHAVRVRPYKVIALDCDDTLWEGVCGEDGPQGVRLDAGRKVLQEFALAQREAGMLLCLSSKNNTEDVYETFRAYPEMPLALDHFVATRLNWNPKSANLRSLAEELNLGLESLILVDN